MLGGLLVTGLKEWERKEVQGRGPRGGGRRALELTPEKRAGLLGRGAFGQRLVQHIRGRGPRPCLPWPGAAALC